MAYLNMTDNDFSVNYTMNQFSTSSFFRSEVNGKAEDRKRSGHSGACSTGGRAYPRVP